MKHAEIRVDPTTPDDVKSLLRGIVDSGDMSTRFLVHTDTEKVFTVLEVWQDFINRNPQILSQILSSYEPGAPPIEATLLADYTNPMSRYKIVTDAGEAQVTEIVFVADMSVERKSVPIASATEYKKVSGDQIAQTVTFDIEHEGKQVELSIHRMGPGGKTIVTVRQSSGNLTT